MLIVPVKENGREKLYKTDAPVSAVSKAFFDSANTSEFEYNLEEQGFTVVTFDAGIYLNFDLKDE